MDRLKFVTCLLLLGPVVGCAQINNSPCATLNAPIQIKPSTSLSLMFGNDEIKSAVDVISRQITVLGNTSPSGLTSLGADAALRTAKANGKNPTANDITALETYLRDDVVPTMKQYPTCNVTVASSDTPDVRIERLFLRKIGAQQFPMIGIANTGLVEANAHIVIRQMLDGIPRSNDTVDTILGPNQRRTISLPEANLPIPEIDSGKTILTIVIDISFPLESGATPVLHREAWRYDHTSREFVSSPLK